MTPTQSPESYQETLARALRISGSLLVVVLIAGATWTRIEDVRRYEAARTRELARQIGEEYEQRNGPKHEWRWRWLENSAGLRAVALHDETGRRVAAFAPPTQAFPPAPGTYSESQGRVEDRYRTTLRLSPEGAEPREARWLTVDSDLGPLRERERMAWMQGGSALLGALVVVAVLAGRLASRLAAPLAKLRKRAQDPKRDPHAATWDYAELVVVDQALCDLVRELEQRDHLLEEQAQSLEQQVRMRTAELVGMNREIAHARSIAEEAMRARSDFLAMMSHELRTPLNAVIGLSSLLNGMPLGKEPKDLAGRIHRSGQRLLDIVGDVLDFSKIDAGKLELEEVRFDPREAVEAACETIAHPLREKGLELVSFIDPNLPTVIGDPGRIQQIVLNYLSNAVKFTREGVISVELTGRSSSLEAVELCIIVRDSGMGISAERQKELFQSFHQAEASIARRFGGTGLGLVISKRLAEMMNGTVGVESKEGEGSAFWCRVVLARANNATQRNLVPASLRDGRVLVAEGDARILRILDRQLEAFGLRTESARESADLVEHLGRGADLIIMEGGLKEDGGLAQLAQQASIPVLALREALSGSATACAVLELPVREDAWEAAFRAAAGGACKPEVPRPTRVDGEQRRVEERKEAEVQAEVVEDAPASDAPQPRPERILLVEDNETNQALTRYLLGQRGFELKIANHGQEALAMLTKQAFDLILMDCQMPVMDGFETTKAIRKRELEEGSSRVPIVAMSANIASEARARCLACGMDDFISKPIDPDHVLEVVESKLAERGATDASEQAEEGSVEAPNQAEAPPERHPEPEAALPSRQQVADREARREPSSGADFPWPDGFDPSILEDLLQAGDMGRELAMDLVKSFEASGEAFDRLEEHIDQKQWEEAGRCAHKLVSTVGNVGASELARLLRRMETFCNRPGDEDLSVDLLWPVRTQCEAVAEALRRLCGPLGAK